MTAGNRKDRYKCTCRNDRHKSTCNGCRHPFRSAIRQRHSIVFPEPQERENNDERDKEKIARLEDEQDQQREGN